MRGKKAIISKIYFFISKFIIPKSFRMSALFHIFAYKFANKQRLFVHKNN